MLISGGRRPRPTSKKNRRLVLTKASGCTLVEFFLTLPPFSRWPCDIHLLLLEGKKLIFIWIYLLLDTETTSVSYFIS